MKIRRAVALSLVLFVGVALGFFPKPLFGGDQQRAKDLVQNTCAQCHRFEGQPESRFNLKAPGLMWAGSKYQRPWLIRWLTGKEAPLYAKGYRWDQDQKPVKHMTVSPAEAEAIADYFDQHNKDQRVKVGAFDLSKVSKFEASFGGMAYKAHACLGCHVIEENGKIIGGPQSASLVAAGQRYNQDWLFRFGQNPQDFVPHSGEFLADATEPQLRAVIGFLMVQGVKDFKYYEPWTSPEFGTASVDRGKVIYKEYCAQCHGATGKGDGPAASGLEPKPAIHANIPFDKVPIDYLYNVINHGGAAMGKSPNMPYWGLTIGQQGVADVMAYLKATFKGGAEVAQAAPSGGSPSGVCPQPRKTVKAPEEFLGKTNPLPASVGTINAGKTLFLQTAQPVACAMCHGNEGNGQGFMGAALIPPPRNFTCGKMMKDLPDGQLFWIIKNGSPGTGMMSFAGLPDDQVWQLIHYIRSLAK
ncbi:MAG: c-type cytochrome [Nitrospirae bacterium]|nr:MAG: c-type cytochrome [Nitrospirota bacterium]